MEIFFDFTKSATRESILNQLCAYFNEDDRVKYEQASAKVNVRDRHHHDLPEIYKTVDALNVSESVKSNMHSIYEILAQAEAHVHESTPDHVHFHEVGRAAGIRNVANICIAFDVLSPSYVRATPVQVGSGEVECAHGRMDIPAPATAAILNGCVVDVGASKTNGLSDNATGETNVAGGKIPTFDERLEGELCTPTSVAVIKHFIDGFCVDEAEIENGRMQRLKSRLLNLGRDADCVVVAFSGGVDSTFLLDVAHDVLGEKVLALTASSAVYPESEEKFAIDFCKQRGIRHKVVNFDVFAVDGFAENTPERCYFCKRALLEQLRDVALEVVRESAKKAQATSNSAQIDMDVASFSRIILMDGTNATDAQDVRPGERAVREAGVVSPLSEAGMTKLDIRALSRERGLSIWNKPSFACLASRVAFGDEISPEILECVDRAERILREHGFDQVRVRAHERGQLARIEVEPSDILRLMQLLCDESCLQDGSDDGPCDGLKNDSNICSRNRVKNGLSGASNNDQPDVARTLHELGFKHVSVDVDGYRTGSMNVNVNVSMNVNA